MTNRRTPVILSFVSILAVSACHGSLHTGIGSNGAGGTRAAPLDTRPARPAWTPPSTLTLGTPGWQQSTEPICSPWLAPISANVWADARGVFALLVGFPANQSSLSTIPYGTSLQFNDGSGWQRVQEFIPTIPEERYYFDFLWPSFPGGSLVVWAEMANKTGIYFVDGDSTTFQTEVRVQTATGEADLVEKGGAAGSGRVYILTDTAVAEYSAGTLRTVCQATGSSFGPSGSRLWDVWADSQSVVAVGDNETILMRTGNGPCAPMPNVPAGNYRSVWAFGTSDVWTINSAGQLLHYDGNNWEVVSPISPDPTGGLDRISSKLWGADGIVYFLTGNEMGRWNGSSVDVLLDLGVTETGTLRFADMWGRSAKEVFVTMADRDDQRYACGGSIILWFDGSQFHQF